MTSELAAAIRTIPLPETMRCPAEGNGAVEALDAAMASALRLLPEAA